MIFIMKKVKISISISLYSISVFKLAATCIYIIFVTKKAKMTKDILDKKVFTTATSTTAPILEFFK